MTFLELQNLLLMQRFNARQRDLVKSWINARYQQVWAAADWPWKKASAILAVIAGTATYPFTDIDSSMLHPISVIRDDGEQLEYMTPQDWDLYFQGDDQSSSTPWAYSVTEGTVTASSGPNPQLILGPTPNQTADYTSRFERRATPLVNDTDVPLLPVQDQIILFSGAMAFGLKVENDPTWDLIETEYQQHLTTMIAQHFPAEVGHNTSFAGSGEWWPY